MRPAVHTARRRGSPNRKRGQAMVEFALVIPVFLLMLCAIADFGFALFSRMTVINSARDGARAAVMLTDHSTIPLVAGNAAKSAAVGGLVTLATDPVVTCLKTNTTDGSFNSPLTIACQDAVAGDTVSVTVNYTYKTFTPVLLGASLNLSATVQMVIDA